MQYKEFQELLRCLGYWLQTFNEFDHDGSRYIEAHELGHCIKDKYSEYKLVTSSIAGTGSVVDGNG